MEAAAATHLSIMSPCSVSEALSLGCSFMTIWHAYLAFLYCSITNTTVWNALMAG